MEKKKLSKEMLNEIVGAGVIGLFGLCVVIGWFKDVFLRSFQYIGGWYGSFGFDFWNVIAMLGSLLGIVAMILCVTGTVLDLVFTFKGKKNMLFTYFQGGGAALGFIVMVFGLWFIDIFLNLCEGYNVFFGRSWYEAGSLIWVITVIAVYKTLIPFIFKEKKADVNSLPPIQ